MKLSPERHNLAKLRLFLKLRQQEMADLAGCSRHAIQSVELGKRKGRYRLVLSESLARKISNETGVAAEWLLENDLKAPLIADHGGAFTIEHYRQRRALSEDGWPATPSQLITYATGGEPKTIAFYAWMRAIFATKNGDIALWRTGKFLEGLAKEYGYNRSVLPALRLEATALRDHKLRWQQAEIGMRLAVKCAREWGLRVSVRLRRRGKRGGVEIDLPGLRAAANKGTRKRKR